MTTTYSSFTELKQQDNATYKLIARLGESSSYLGGDMKTGHWFIKNNPYLVTDAQWAKIAVRMLSYDSLKNQTLPDVIETFYYEQRTLRVGDQTFYIPSGSIMGYMQGMFMCISADGTINT
jgi:hypothetical protein